MEEERRRNPRISARVRVEFVERTRSEAQTINVARNGIFIEGETKRSVNSLVRLKLYLPPTNQAIEIFGRVARKGSVKNTEGIAVNFLEVPSTDRDRWLEFVNQVEQLETTGSFQDHSSAPAPSPAPQERRRAPRTESSFMVRFKTVERLQSFVTSNLSAGGMFLATPVLKTVGSRVQIVLVHPKTDKDFDLEAEVVHVNTTSTLEQPKGMGLKFVALTEERQAALQTFVEHT